MTISRSLIASATLAIGALATSVSGALAGGDVIYGGVKDAGVAVPVPVPVPVPEVSTRWYVRIDAAYGMSDVSKYKSTDPHVDSIRADSYLDNFPRYGLGFGYYFNRWLRADITVDQRNDVDSRGFGQVSYMSGTSEMRGTYADSFKSSNSTGLVNLYADLPFSDRFTPYVGAGIGFVRHQLKGRNFESVTDCMTNCPGLGPVTVSTASTTAGGVDYQLAAALMAGFSFRIVDDLKLDLGYRWLYLQGASFTGRSFTTVENLKIPDQNTHELRVGLRYDIN